MKTNYFKLFALAILCCISTTMYAVVPVTQVTDSTSFATAFNAMKIGGGGTIELMNDITLILAKLQTYALESDISNPIQINTKEFKIIPTGATGVATGDNANLQIGNYVDIYGTNVVLKSVNRAIIRVVGGSVKTYASFGVANAAAIWTSDAWVYVSGGTVSVEAAIPVGNNFAIYMTNNFTTVVTGGTISATGDNTRALNVGNGAATITGATITANGNGAYALLASGSNTMTISDNTTITTTSAGGTDAALVSDGTTSKITIASTVANVNITSSHKYKLDNAGGAVIDLRGLTLSASPVDGSSLTYPSNNVTITATGNESSATCGIYYGYTVAPTTASPNIASGATVAASSATTVIKASIGKNGFIDTNVFTFNYTVSNLPAGLPIDVSTFADLLTAYTNSQTGTPRTTKINLLANLTTAGAYSIVPSASYPVEITCNTFYIKIGSAGTWGGNLIMSNGATSTVGLIQNAGAFTTNITGGTYTANSNVGLIYANSGAGIDNTLTKLNISNAAFNLNGTTNAASVIKYATSNGNLVSFNNCTLNVSAKSQAINCVGPLNVSITNSTINVAGSDATSIAVNYAPTNAAPNVLTMSGLTVNMTAGKVMVLGGTKALNVVVKDLTVSSGTPTLYTYTAGTGGTLKFYDFRAFTSTASPASGQFRTDPNVTLTFGTTAVLPVDAAGATMVYTLDGTDPISTSPVYSVPISFAGGTIKAAALKDNFLGKIYTFTYSPVNEPTTSAPTPPVYAAPKVTSIFSDAYTNVAGTDFNPNWSQAGSETIVQVAGNNTLKVANLNYQGIAFGSPVNALPMNYLHVDVFTSTETSLKITCISASTGEKFYQLTPLNLNAWNSYDIPLNAFTSQGLGISDLIQFKFDGSGGQTSYIDNLYFYQSDPTPDTTPPTAFTATVGTIATDAVTLLLNGTDNSGAVNYEITYGTTTLKTSGVSGVQKSFIVPSLTGSTAYSFSVVCKDATGNVAANNPIVVAATTLTPLPVSPTPTRLAAQVKSIYSDAYTPAVTVTEWSNWWSMTFTDYTFTAGNNGKKAISTNPGGCGSPTFVATPLDVTGMTLVHVDVYPISTMDIGLQVITITPTTANWVSLGTLTPNQWNSIDIPLTSFTNSVKTDLKQVGFITTASFGTFYMDNLYFWKDPATSVANVETSTVKCYPSQVTDRFNVKAETEISQVTVRNLLGQSVKSVAVNSNEQSIDLSAVSSGNYFVTVKLVNGQSATQKIIKL